MGGHWLLTGAKRYRSKTQKKTVPRNCVPLLPGGGIGTRVQKRGLVNDLWHVRVYWCPIPSVRQPLFETSELSAGLKRGGETGGGGGVLHRVASTLRWGIPCLLKNNQIARDNRLPVQCRYLRLRRHRTVILVVTQMLLPPVWLPPVKPPQK